MGGKVAMQLALNLRLINKLVVLDISPVANNPRHSAIFAGWNEVASQMLLTGKPLMKSLQNT